MNLAIDSIRLTEGLRLRWCSRDELDKTPLAYGFNPILAAFFSDIARHTDI
jgi:hypothetical protein